MQSSVKMNNNQPHRTYFELEDRLLKKIMVNISHQCFFTLY